MTSGPRPILLAACLALIACGDEARRDDVGVVAIPVGAEEDDATAGPEKDEVTADPEDIGTPIGPFLDRSAGAVGYSAHTFAFGVVKLGTPEVRGSVSTDAVRSVFRSALGAFSKCYSVGLSMDPGLVGAATMRLVISPSGKVDEVGIAETSLTDRGGLLGCLMTTIRGLSFPALDGGESVEVSYEIILARDTRSPPPLPKLSRTVPDPWRDLPSPDDFPGLPSDDELTDAAVLEVAYKGPKVPHGFYWEPHRDGKHIYYENRTTVPRRDPGGVCTDDAREARKWVRAAADADSRIGAATETDKYFELKTISKRTMYRRVHKCSYLRWRRGRFVHFTGHLRNLGTFGVRPITKKNAKEMVEYFWFINHRKLGGSNVLRSLTQDTEGAVEVLLYETMLRHGDWGLCDQIFLLRSMYVIDKTSGFISHKRDELRTIEGRCHPSPKFE